MRRNSLLILLVPILIIIASLILMILKPNIKEIKLGDNYDNVCFKENCTGFASKNKNEYEYYDLKLNEIIKLDKDYGKAIFLSDNYFIFLKDQKYMTFDLKTKEFKEISEPLFVNSNYYVTNEKDKFNYYNYLTKKNKTYSNILAYKINNRVYLGATLEEQDNIYDEIIDDKGKTILTGYNLDDLLREKYIIVSTKGESLTKKRRYYLFDPKKEKLYKDSFHSYTYSLNEDGSLILNKYQEDNTKCISVDLKNMKEIRCSEYSLKPRTYEEFNNYLLHFHEPAKNFTLYSNSTKYLGQENIITYNSKLDICYMLNIVNYLGVSLKDGKCNLNTDKYYINRTDNLYAMSYQNHVYELFYNYNLGNLPYEFEVIYFNEYQDEVKEVIAKNNDEIKTYIYKKNKREEVLDGSYLLVNQKALYNMEVEGIPYKPFMDYEYLLDKKSGFKSKIEEIELVYINDVPHLLVSTKNKVYLVNLINMMVYKTYDGLYIGKDNGGFSYINNNIVNYVSFNYKTYTYKGESKFNPYPNKDFNLYSSNKLFITSDKNNIKVISKKGKLIKEYKGYNINKIYNYDNHIIVDLRDELNKPMLVLLK